MNAITKNVLVVLAGLVVGSLVNIGLVNLGPAIVPLPEGADISTMEGLSKSMQLFAPVNFLFPFLGHALGTLAGAFIAARFTTNHSVRFAFGVGVFFLMGGISAVIMLGGPLWFKVIDLLFAYIPMGFLGALLAGATGKEAVEHS